MSDCSFTTAFSVEQTPEAAFAAITDVRGWWSGEIEGPTDQLGGEFTYRHQDLHYSRQQVTELVPGKRVTWRVVDSRLTFVEHQGEWTGTTITFEIGRRGGATEVRFTHLGLSPDRQCYQGCAGGWRFFIDGSLRRFIGTGERQRGEL